MPNVPPEARPGCRFPNFRSTRQLQADAQAWSAHMAATGSVADPTLPPCDEQANQVCVLAANSGNTGYGFWPGDGSDGMNGDYMESAAHRQNQLGAAYNLVGVGVTCSANQAWTVELFGYTYGDLPSAYARENSQNVFQGDPVPSTPMVAGAPSGDSGLLPGTDLRSQRRGHPDRRPVPVPVPGAVGAGRAQHRCGPGRGRGLDARLRTATGWPGRTDRSRPAAMRSTTARWPARR